MNADTDRNGLSRKGRNAGRIDTIKIGKAAIDVIPVEGYTCKGCIFRGCSHCPEEINPEWDCMNYRPEYFGAPVMFTCNNADPAKLNHVFTYKLKKSKNEKVRL